jgi:predicted transcriptional regulator of viral defense system
MESYNATINSMLIKNKGFLTSSEVTDAAIPRRVLSELVEAGIIYRVDRGIYAKPEAWEDEMYLLQHRFSKGIYSYETALYLHNTTDRTPHIFTLTFPHGYNASGLKGRNAKAKFVKNNLYDLGMAEVLSPCGNPLCVYNIERTLCDICKGNNACDIQIINQAMKLYASSKTKDIGKLVAYAEQLRVKPKILTYMEILL